MIRAQPASADAMRILALLLAVLVLIPAPGASAQTLAERLGHPPEAKLLLLHADDLGVAHSVNAASIRAFETGGISSASLMVPCPWLPEIAAYARQHPEADLGLHLTLTSEWKHYRWDAVLPADQVPSLLDSLGYLPASTEEVARGARPAEVEAELRAQVERALALGIRPTHLDSHMGALFTTPALFEAYLRVGRAYGLPLLLPREQLAGAPALLALLTPDDLVIDRIAMASPEVSVAGWAAYYSRILETLPPGVTELIVHLAYDDAEMQAVMADHPDYGAAWRQRDFDFVTSDTFRRLLAEHDVTLITWREIGALLK
jgi:predicted glycoside hydrolase/deacetylase ChbG (UPF0249 family)